MSEFGQQHPWRTQAPAPAPARRHRRRLGVAGLALGVAAIGTAAAGGVGFGPAPFGGSGAGGTGGVTASGSAVTALPALDTTGLAGGGTVSSAAAAVTPGVVDITTQLGYQNASAAGTGMLLTSSGEVLTNNHVIDGATSITVTVVGTGRSYPARVVGTAPTQDVAVIQMQGATGLATVPIGQSAASSGQTVVAIGNARGRGGAPSVVSGSVTATGRTITAGDASGSSAEQLTNMIETNADIVAGDSGGPLATLNGAVVGMDTAASSSSTSASSTSASSATSATAGAHQGYAIPIARAIAVARQIESGTASATVHIGSRGFVGVSVQGRSQAGYGSFGDGYAGAAGATIGGVVSGGPAETAGLQAGDVITSVDGSTISSATDLTTTLQQTRAGQQVTLGWTDAGGQSHEAPLTLGTGPAD